MAIPPTEAKVDLYLDTESFKLKERKDGDYKLIFKDYKKKTYWEVVDPETNELVNGYTNLNKIINKSNVNGEDNLFLLNSKPTNPGDAPFKIDSSEDLAIETPSIKDDKLILTQDLRDNPFFQDLFIENDNIYNLSFEMWDGNGEMPERPRSRWREYMDTKSERVKTWIGWEADIANLLGEPRNPALDNGRHRYNFSDEGFGRGLDAPESTREAYRRLNRNVPRYRTVFRNAPNWLPDFNRRRLVRTNFKRTFLKRANLSNVLLKKNNFYRADARFVNLNNARLIGVEGDRVDLRKSDFRNSFVTASQFHNAKLSFADLRKSFFKVVSLKGVSAFEADLRGARLFNVDLRDAELIHAKFSEDTIINFVDFRGANLRGADFGGVNLDNMNLSKTRLTYADLSGVSMRNAKFKNANLSDLHKFRANAAILKGADIRGVDFSGANLEGVDFTGMDLTGVNFSGASLQQANLTGITYDSTTIFDSVSDWTNTIGFSAPSSQ